jgi:hypothetical protein
VLELAPADRRRIDETGGKAGRVLEQVQNRHRLAVRAAPFRKKIRHGLVETQQAGPHLLHHNRGRRDDFGERGQIERRRLGRWTGGGERQRPERLVPEDAGPGADVDDRRRKHAPIDRGAEHVPGAVEIATQPAGAL